MIPYFLHIELCLTALLFQKRSEKPVIERPKRTPKIKVLPRELQKYITKR